MKRILLCVGHLKGGPEKDLLEQYRTRLNGAFDMKEVVCRKKGSVEQVKEWEGALLMEALDPGSVVIGLDEQGDMMSSQAFSEVLQKFENQGVKTLTFVVGGADGLSLDVRKKCQSFISFGRMTWPHLLVRGMLVEQLYRAQQIKAGHPYHKV